MSTYACRDERFYLCASRKYTAKGYTRKEYHHNCKNCGNGHKYQRRWPGIRREFSTRAAAGLERPAESEICWGPGPRPRSARVVECRGKCGELVPQRPQPSDGSSSKCLEEGYGRPLKTTRRPFLNFCKRLIRVKEKPSNCPPCPVVSSEPQESFWDYLFKFDERPTPPPSACRVAHRHREACRKTDPRLCDPRYTRTPGEVLLFTESSRLCTQSSMTEPEPRPPPSFTPPKSIALNKLAETNSRGTPGNEADPRCRTRPRPCSLPFAECRPHRRTRKPFRCHLGVHEVHVALPVSTDRGTCGGRSVGEILAEATVPKYKPSSILQPSSRHPADVDLSDRSRFTRLQQLTNAGCSVRKN